MTIGAAGDHELNPSPQPVPSMSLFAWGLRHTQERTAGIFSALCSCVGYGFRFVFILLGSVRFGWVRLGSVLRDLPLEAGLVQAYYHERIEQLKEARTAAESNPRKLLRYGNGVQRSYSIEQTFYLSLLSRSNITLALSGKAQR